MVLLSASDSRGQPSLRSFLDLARESLRSIPCSCFPQFAEWSCFPKTLLWPRPHWAYIFVGCFLAASAVLVEHNCRVSHGSMFLWVSLSEWVEGPH